ncbi:MAG: hypothetical protein KBC30_07180 [Planctomycetes bacterium]|jgi:hypothetical protein|nr:hypothetical protein [Planctomycetota bacterium]HNZ67418.1 hypothetical protein [Planctomycetota bacterium]HPY75538.1 hypothetical protein [Planctomycetota bacterium]HQB01598.1 hypothetical protein [Planctomycetota bacterium]
MKKIMIMGIAFLAAFLEQLFHESVHALVALLVQADVHQFHFFAVDISLPSTLNHEIWRACCIHGSASLANIVCFFIFWWLFSLCLHRRWLALFFFYFASFSLFSGFGYLFFDAVVINEHSVGDWSQVLLLLGNPLWLRIILFVIGSAGIVWGYFWMGKHAQYFQIQGLSKKQSGFVLCVGAYLFVNIIFTALSVFHPLGNVGIMVVIFKSWLGFSGFFWAFFIQYICRDLPQPKYSFIL